MVPTCCSAPSARITLPVYGITPSDTRNPLSYAPAANLRKIMTNRFLLRYFGPSARQAVDSCQIVDSAQVFVCKFVKLELNSFWPQLQQMSVRFCLLWKKICCTVVCTEKCFGCWEHSEIDQFEYESATVWSLSIFFALMACYENEKV